MRDNLIDTGIALVGIIALLAMFNPPSIISDNTSKGKSSKGDKAKNI